MGHKYWWFTISGIIIAAGLISLFVKGGGNPVDGLNYGLEFKEGTRIAVAFEQPPTLAEVRARSSRGRLRRRADPADAERRRQRRGGLPDPDAGAHAGRAGRTQGGARRASSASPTSAGTQIFSARDGGRDLRPPGRELVAQGRRAGPAPDPHLRHDPLPVEVRHRAPSPPRSTTCSS